MDDNGTQEPSSNIEAGNVDHDGREEDQALETSDHIAVFQEIANKLTKEWQTSELYSTEEGNQSYIGASVDLSDIIKDPAPEIPKFIIDTARKVINDRLNIPVAVINGNPDTENPAEIVIAVLFSSPETHIGINADNPMQKVHAEMAYSAMNIGDQLERFRSDINLFPEHFMHAITHRAIWETLKEHHDFEDVLDRHRNWTIAKTIFEHLLEGGIQPDAPHPDIPGASIACIAINDPEIPENAFDNAVDILSNVFEEVINEEGIKGHPAEIGDIVTTDNFDDTEGSLAQSMADSDEGIDFTQEIDLEEIGDRIGICFPNAASSAEIYELLQEYAPEIQKRLREKVYGINEPTSGLAH